MIWSTGKDGRWSPWRRVFLWWPAEIRRGQWAWLERVWMRKRRAGVRSSGVASVVSWDREYSLARPDTEAPQPPPPTGGRPWDSSSLSHYNPPPKTAAPLPGLPKIVP